MSSKERFQKFVEKALKNMPAPEELLARLKEKEEETDASRLARIDAILEEGYDPKICITAGDLRRAGFDIDGSIPDVAWVPRCALKLSCEVTEGEERTVNITCDLKLLAPFQWAMSSFTSKTEQ